MAAFDTVGLSILVARLQAAQDSMGTLAASGSVLPVELRDKMVTLVSEVEEFSKAHQFEMCATTSFYLSSHIKEGSQIHAAGMEADLRNLKQALLTDAGKCVVFRVLPDKVKYLEADKLFGDEVDTAFPSVSKDIRNAGYCLATECHTAAVFHLMRVAERGLRALARDRRVALPKKGSPIELATWEEIIRELEKSEEAIRSYPKTLAREAQYEFYHGAMMQFRRFKNVFRNRAMHSRDDFGRTQAVAVFENVRDFMATLSTRISERDRTPLVWKGVKWTVTTT
jgi:hypothetical protein